MEGRGKVVKRNKKISLAIMLVVMVILSLPAKAADKEVERMGGIKICLADSQTAETKEGVVFEYAMIAKEEEGKYKKIINYKSMDIDFNLMQSASDMEKAAKELVGCMVADGSVKTDKKGEACISNLSAGIYMLRVVDGSQYDVIRPFLVKIPMWDEVLKNMNYEVTVVPKHSPYERIVTGDDNFYQNYLVLFLISFIIVVGLTCHNQFECGRISDSYSEKREKRK